MAGSAPFDRSTCTSSALTKHLVRPARRKALHLIRNQDGCGWGHMTQEQLDKMRRCVTDPKIDAKTVKVTCYDGDVLEGFIEL